MSDLGHDALWMKAKLFINHAMDEGDLRTFDERGVWASIALELLAKAALSKSSPLLIVATSDDMTNHLALVGLTEATGPTPRTITASQIYDRCQKAFRPFSAREAKSIASARNAYLHSGVPSLLVIPPEVWWPKYWAQAEILITALDREVGEFVGYGRAQEVELHLAKNKLRIEHVAQMLIGRAKQRDKQLREGTVPARVAKEWAAGFNLSASMEYSASTTCPACDNAGRLEGGDVESFEVRHEHFGDDEYDSWVDLTVAADHFSCDHCRLVLDGYELLVEADLPVSFEAVGDPGDFYEPEYFNE